MTDLDCDTLELSPANAALETSVLDAIAAAHSRTRDLGSIAFIAVRERVVSWTTAAIDDLALALEVFFRQPHAAAVLRRLTPLELAAVTVIIDFDISAIALRFEAEPSINSRGTSGAPS